MNPETPNHALQRTAPCVTAPASAAAFPPAMQVPRRTPRSLSLGSLGAFRASPEMKLQILTYKRTHNGDPDVYGCFGIHDCMGSVRDLPFDAVIGVGGI